MTLDDATTALPHVALMCAHQLRDALGEWAYPETRKIRLEECKDMLARAMAEADTGISQRDARMVSLYPSNQVSQQQRDDARCYRIALSHAGVVLGDLKYTDMMAYCDALAAPLAVSV